MPTDGPNLVRIRHGLVHLGQVLKWLVVLIGLTVLAVNVLTWIQEQRRSDSGGSIRYTPRQIRTMYLEMMRDICRDEADLFDARSVACRDRASRGAPWDEVGDDAENLRICPYLRDVPNPPTWSEQARVWDRAAERSRLVAERYARRE